ncbi:MAG: AAA family ATPase [Acidisphaera sp.]|nr:AAA family ATPase [Acidisphaera sp.]
MPLLCVSSPKGGVGKTTIAANLAWELSRLGRRVIVLDLDPQNAVGLHYGMDLRDATGFMSALRTLPDPRQSWRKALRTSAYGVSYLPYGHVGMAAANALSLALAANPDMLVAPVRDMLAEPDTVVVADMPPGPTPTLSSLLPLAALLLIVLRVDAPSLAQLPAIESGRAYGIGPASVSQATAAGPAEAPQIEAGPIEARPIEARQVGFVLNQLDLRTRLGRASGDTAAKHLGQRLLGVVYRDENVSEAIASQKMVGDYAPQSKAAQDIAALAGVVARRLAPAPAVASQEDIV